MGVFEIPRQRLMGAVVVRFKAALQKNVTSVFFFFQVTVRKSLIYCTQQKSQLPSLHITTASI